MGHTKEWPEKDHTVEIIYLDATSMPMVIS